VPSKLKEYSYNDLVFINCPFDNDYQPLFQAIIYTVYFCGFYPTSAMAEDNAMDNRIDKLIRIIGKSKFGIHDISRTEPDSTNNLPRFNMPFELGLFMEHGNMALKNRKIKMH